MNSFEIKEQSQNIEGFSVFVPQTSIEISDNQLDDFYPIDFKINNQLYNLDDKLPFVTELMEVRKKEILGQIDLSEIIKNLDLCAELLYLAYNGVAGETGIQSKLSRLQSELEKLCSEANLAMKLFKNECEAMTINMVQVFQFMINCDEVTAIELLDECAESAGKMADKASELAQRFETMADLTQEAHEETIDRRNIRDEEQKALKQKRQEMVSQLKAASAKFEDLGEDIEEAAADLLEAKADSKAAQERELILGITTVAANALGGIASTALAGFMAYKGAGATALSSAQTNLSDLKKETEEQKEAAEKPVKEAKEKKEIAEAEVKEAEEEVENLEEEKKEVEAKVEEIEDKADPEAEKELKDLKSKIKSLESKLAKANKKKTTSKENLKAATKAFNAAMSAFNTSMETFNTQMNKQQDIARSAAESARKEVSELRQRKNELRKEKREILGSIKAFSSSIKNAQSDEDIIRITIESLNQAIVALSKIVVALKSATHFWKSLQLYCEQLSKPKFKTKLNAFSKMKVERRLPQYYKPAFLFQIVDYAVRWKALSQVCAAYELEADKARVKVLSNIELDSVKSASIAGARRLAPILAQKLLGYVKSEEDRFDDAERQEREAEDKLIEEVKLLTDKK